jgi:hypothetical protein
MDRGFYVKNLYEMTRVLREIALKTKWPTACFVLSEIAQTIAKKWDGHPVSVEEANHVTENLRPLASKVLDNMEVSKNVEVMAALDELVMTSLKLGF